MATQAATDRWLAAATVTSSERQLLNFSIDQQEYALDITNVVQVVRMVAITRSPRTPEVVEGIINLRGKVIPVISLRKLFGLSTSTYSLNDHLLIAQTGNRMVALIVDLVKEVLMVPSDSLEPPSEIAPEMMQYLAAVAKLGDRLLLLLDLGRVLELGNSGRGLENVLQDVGLLERRIRAALVNR